MWNELCALMNWAEQEQRFGRREALLHAYGKMLDHKKRAGKAIAKAHRLLVQHGLPDLDAAYAFARAERVEDVRRRLTPRQFAVESRHLAAARREAYHLAATGDCAHKEAVWLLIKEQPDGPLKYALERRSIE